jgi:hypothetical protein
MACLLANGRALECREAIGGIRNVYFVNQAVMGAYTLDADNELTDVATASDAYKYALNPQGSSFDEVITVSEENGTIFYEQSLILALPNLTSSAIKQLKVLTQGRYQVFVEDNNINTTTGHGDLYLAGSYNGMTVTAGNVGRGQAYGDMSGYNLTFMGREQEAAFVVNPSTDAADIFGGVTTTITVVTS